MRQYQLQHLNTNQCSLTLQSGQCVELMREPEDVAQELSIKCKMERHGGQIQEG